MSHRARPRSSEDGAITLFIALSIVVLCGITAFTVDFGMAYVQKRNLQTAADASSLAAAAAFVPYSGDCTTLKNNTAAMAAAQAAADALRKRNNNGVDRQEPISVTCSPDGKALDVTYGATGSSPVFFGGVLGQSGSYGLGRTATARLFVPDQPEGLRPYAICNADLPTSDPDIGVHKVLYPRDPPCEKPNGDWYQLNCPEVTQGNGSSTLADKTMNGCAKPVEIVPGQPAPPTSPDTVLKAACGGGLAPDCLGADPGNNFSDKQVLKAWKYLVGRQIALPVFKGGTVLNPTGNNALYPVYRLVGVTVCGYHWGKKGSHDPNEQTDISWYDTQAGPCSGADASSGDNSENYLILHFNHVQVTGGSSQVDCGGLGQGCDGGQRAVKLVN